MRIGVIQASSQRGMNAALYRGVQEAVRRNGRGDTVINYGVTEDENLSCSYVETAVSISLLLESGTVDFVVTGCTSGQGMMLACNSLPSVMCGFAGNPEDAYFFGRINHGNALSLPLGRCGGWMGTYALQCTLDRLFEGEFGCGYPPEDAARRKGDALRVRELMDITRRSLPEVLRRCDRTWVRHVLERQRVWEDVLVYGQNREMIELIRKMRCGEERTGARDPE